jgi:hypothetical protein
MRYITIKESHYQTDLLVLKSRLESEGIQCLLKNELTTQILNHIPSFLVELQVPDIDLKRVREIMFEMGELQQENTEATCPECDSEKISLKLSPLKRIQLFFSILYVALGANLPMDKLFRKSKFQCRECKYEFF